VHHVTGDSEFAYNFGVGIDVIPQRNIALRLEIRDDVGGRDLSAEFEPDGTYYLRSSQHLVGFRIGVTFR
jgi:opacity protein-like surface antigen